MKLNLVKKIYSEIYKIRSIEEEISKKYHEQQMRCPIHLSVGQEIVSAVFSQIVKKTDYAVSTHRSHAHYLAKGGNLNKMIAELYGKETGCTNGKGGSMHLVDIDVNFMGSSPIVGNIIPIGVGLGLSAKVRKTNQISFVFLGDGSIEEGAFYESVNFARVKELPILFICENNLYSVYSDLSERQPLSRNNTKMVKSIGVDSKFCKGDDIDSIYKSIKYAVSQIKKNKKPFFLEFTSYRWREHCGPNYDNNIGYRTEAEFLLWKNRDPLSKIRKSLLKNKEINKKLILQEKKINLEIKKAFDFAKKSKFPKQKNAYKGEYAVK
jgi:TPP-dependent pyruvate/acetoin dehydrogenase alpha subunit